MLIALLAAVGIVQRILKQLNSNGKLIAFDQDADAIKNVPDDTG